MSLPADGPQDDFCLLLNEFEVSGPPSIEDDDKEGDKTDDLSDTEDAVPEMPSFPPDQVQLYLHLFTH